MDRTISPEISRRRQWRNGFRIILVLAALGCALFFLRKSLRTSVQQQDILIATIEKGRVEQTLNARGEIVPAFEQVITSPIRAAVREVLHSAGERVGPGQPILVLDKSLTELEYQRLSDELELQRNTLRQLQMELDRDLQDAELNNQIKRLNITRLSAELEDARRLLQVGGRTQEDVTRAENTLRIEELEKQKLENDLRYRRQSMSLRLRDRELQVGIGEKKLGEMEHKLHQADILADRPGVLTWVNENIGASISEGETLVRLADLSAFRVEGSLPDAYADRMAVGYPVIVKMNSKSLRGQITQIKPAVKDGVVQFTVEFDEQPRETLRPNMEVEVYIITSLEANTLRVKNGPAFTGKKVQDLFVLTSDGKADRREVEIGLTSFDYVEIRKGLQAGDKVIISDMSRYDHIQQIKINP